MLVIATVLKSYRTTGMMIATLTMRKHAPIITAFILTSRSMGNWMPKLSESVKASRRRPVHCLLIFPILLVSSMVKIWGKSQSEHMLNCVALGCGSVPNCLVPLEGDHRTIHNAMQSQPHKQWLHFSLPNSDFKAARGGTSLGNTMLQLALLWVLWKVCITDPNRLHSSI